MRRMLFVLIAGIMLLISTSYPNRAIAGVNVNIGIGVPLPSVVISAPPAVVLIPGTYAYFVPDADVDILFYHGYWYRPYKGYWYSSRSYNGPWVYMVPARVPRSLLYLPPDFRHVPPGYEHIPYGHLKKHWKKWEREKYWDRHKREHEKREWHKEKRMEHRDKERHRGD